MVKSIHAVKRNDDLWGFDTRLRAYDMLITDHKGLQAVMAGAFAGMEDAAHRLAYLYPEAEIVVDDDPEVEL